jgi:hypothetical protein
MTARQINHASASETSSDSSGNLPCFEQFFPWQAARLANGAANFVEQRVAREKESFLFCQAVS